MTPEERERWAEQWMDATLKQQRDVEPRPGLETRVLASLAARTASTRLSWLHSGARVRFVAIAVAAILILVVAYSLRPPHREPPRMAHEMPAPRVATPSAPSGSTSPAASATGPYVTNANTGRRIDSKHKPTTTAVAHASRQDGTRAPRMAQFPAPAPLTNEEKLLLRYVQQTPREELIAVVNEKRLFEERSREVEAETNALRGPTQ